MTRPDSPSPSWLKVFWPASRFWLALAGMGMPAAYIAFRHIDGKERPDAKKRMLISQAVFWPVAVLGLRVMHVGLFRHRDNMWRAVGGILTGSGIVAAGFEGGMRLARKLVPKPPQNMPPPNSTAAAPRPFSPSPPSASNVMLQQQAYQQGFRAGYRQAQQASPYSGYAGRLPLPPSSALWNRSGF